MKAARIDLTLAEVERADVLLQAVRAASPPGARISRVKVLRAALARGFDVLAVELAAHLPTSGAGGVK